MKCVWLIRRILPALAGTLIWTAAASQIPRLPPQHDEAVRAQRTQIRADQAPQDSALARGRATIDGYFRATLNRRYGEMAAHLAPVLRRFFGKSNITREQAIAEAREYNRKKGIRALSYKIRWASAEQQATADGYQYKFIMNYKIRSKDPRLPKTFLLEVTAALNKDFKIESLTEYVIERSKGAQ